jgi:hypothetical protein
MIIQQLAVFGHKKELVCRALENFLCYNLFKSNPHADVKAK